MEIKTPQDWWNCVDMYWDDLCDIISRYVPGQSYNPKDMWISAPQAEQACQAIRDQIYVPHPVKLAIQAKEDKDFSALRDLFGKAWFGMPESTESRYVPGFSQLCDLCSEDWVFEQDQ